jgi:hypothetical protein
MTYFTPGPHPGGRRASSSGDRVSGAGCKQASVSVGTKTVRMPRKLGRCKLLLYYKENATRSDHVGGPCIGCLSTGKKDKVGAQSLW